VIDEENIPKLFAAGCRQERRPMPQGTDHPTRREFFRNAAATLATAVITGAAADAQTSTPANADSVMMTIFLRHDESKSWTRSMLIWTKQDSTRTFRRRESRLSRGT
jgi:hypothetical protein